MEDKRMTEKESLELISRITVKPAAYVSRTEPVATFATSFGCDVASDYSGRGRLRLSKREDVGHGWQPQCATRQTLCYKYAIIVISIPKDADWTHPTTGERRAYKFVSKVFGVNK